MKILVTGAAGFVGRHLLAVIEASHPGAKLFGMVRPGTTGLPLPGGAETLSADAEDASAVLRVLQRAAPDRIFHLAAQSSPRLSFEDAEATLRTNLFGLLHVLEAVRRLDLRPRILAVGSAEEYGRVDREENPIPETAPLRPASPYAVSKVAQEFLARQFAAAHSMDVVITRTFHHSGSGRGEAFAESSFAKQIAEIEAAHRPPVIEVGNLDSVRDFTDVRDVCRAYLALLERGQSGEAYNVCSGVGIRIGDVLDLVLTQSGVHVDVRKDPGRLRPGDNPVMIGNPWKIQAATGWSPHVPLPRTLGYLLQYWRERVGAPNAVSP